MCYILNAKVHTLTQLMRSKLMLAMICVFATGCNDWKTTDNVEIVSESRSPDGKYIATVFHCSGGGAAGYHYENVNLRKVSDDFNQRDYLLGKYGWPSFENISVNWKDSTNLEVYYRWSYVNAEDKKKNGQKVSEKEGVKIDYILQEADQKPLAN